MGVSAELEVDGGVLSLLKMIGLMVKQNREALQTGSKVADRSSATCRPVVATDYVHTFVVSHRIFQQRDASLAEEALRQLHIADVLMVAENRINGCLQVTELLGVVPFYNGTQTAVNDVTADEHQVGVLSIDELHPSCQLSLSVVITDMQVAGQDDGQRLLQGFRGVQRQFLAILMVIVKTTQHHDQRNDGQNRQEPYPTLFQKSLRQQVA